MLNCVTYNRPLDLSDRAKNFIAAPLKYSPERESAVFISNISLRSYKVFNVKNLLLSKTVLSFFTREKESEVSRNSNINRCDMAVGISEKSFSPIGQGWMGSSRDEVRHMENQSLPTKF